MKRGKKYRQIAEKVEKGKSYSPKEALQLITANKAAKFDESVEVHIRLGIDPKKGEEQARGTVILPHGTGKTKKVAVITSTKTKEAKEAGADLIGGEELITAIKNGKMEAVDVIVASPEMMPKLAPVAKILGPRGLMPSPKTETVTDKIAAAVENIKKGKVSFKNDAQGNIHQVIGKVSFSDKALIDNLNSFLEAVARSKQSAVKGKYILSASVCSTMGPGIKLQS